MSTEIATYRRIRAAIAAAGEQDVVTDLAGSTELSLPDAAAYARDHSLLEGLHGVRIVQRVGKLEIGPERRSRVSRRSGADRRAGERSGGLWAERRTGSDRRRGIERRVPAGPVWEPSS